MSSVLEHWVQLLASKESGLPRADQVARLAELLAPLVPGSEKVFQALGEHLERHVRHLSGAGRASLKTAFPSGGGPDFPCKAALLSALNPASRRRSRSRDRERVRGTSDKAGNGAGKEDRTEVKEERKGEGP